MFPAVDSALRNTLEAFGVPRESVVDITPEMREIAARFNIEEAINEYYKFKHIPNSTI